MQSSAATEIACMHIHVNMMVQSPLHLYGGNGVIGLHTTDVHSDGLLHVYHGLVQI